MDQCQVSRQSSSWMLFWSWTQSDWDPIRKHWPFTVSPLRSAEHRGSHPWTLSAFVGRHLISFFFSSYYYLNLCMMDFILNPMSRVKPHIWISLKEKHLICCWRNGGSKSWPNIISCAVKSDGLFWDIFFSVSPKTEISWTIPKFTKFQRHLCCIKKRAPSSNSWTRPWKSLSCLMLLATQV